jgi:hypothetical protein
VKFQVQITARSRIRKPYEDELSHRSGEPPRNTKFLAVKELFVHA